VKPGVAAKKPKGKGRAQRGGRLMSGVWSADLEGNLQRSTQKAVTLWQQKKT